MAALAGVAGVIVGAWFSSPSGAVERRDGGSLDAASADLALAARELRTATQALQAASEEMKRAGRDRTAADATPSAVSRAARREDSASSAAAATGPGERSDAGPPRDAVAPPRESLHRMASERQRPPPETLKAFFEQPNTKDRLLLMTYAEVLELLGPPSTILGAENGSTWVYEGHGRVYFVDGRAIGAGGHF